MATAASNEIDAHNAALARMIDQLSAIPPARAITAAAIAPIPAIASADRSDATFHPMEMKPGSSTAHHANSAPANAL